MNSLYALVVATAVLVLIPGPNVALIVANSIRFGFRAGVATVVGTTAGLAIQLALVVAGLAVVVQFAAEALSWIRWAGVAYLVWLGVRTWRAPASDLSEVRPAKVLFWRGCLLAAVNPKTLLFNAAFIPQFTGGAASPATVAAVFLAVVFIGDLLWAGFASSAHRLLSRYAGWRNRLTGAFLTAAGIGLALSRR